MIATGDGTHALSTTATASATVTVTNTDTTAPSFGGLVITNKVYTQGEEIFAVVLPVATDAVSTTEASLTYELPGLPTGLTFEESTRTLSGMPTNAQPATEYSYTATNEAGNTSVGLTFMITVNPNAAPEVSITEGSSVTVGEGEMTTLTATGSTGNTYVWVCTSPPTTLANADQNALTFTAPTVDANVQYTCIVIATGDGTHALSTTATASATVMVTNTDTTAPSFGGLVITNKVYTQGEEIAPVVLPAATDAVSTTEASLTYQLPGLPAGLTFQESTRMLSGRPINAQLATEYSYTATDEAGDRSAELTFMITVNPNAAPEVSITEGSSVTVGEGEMTTLTATGSMGNTYVWVCTSPPATLANADQNALTFTAPMVDANVQYTCIVIATGDGTHALSTTATASATVTVTNTDTTAPSFGGLVIANKEYRQGEEIAPVVLPAATDAVSTTDSSLTYQLSGLPYWSYFSGKHPHAQWHADKCEALPPSTSYTATDEAGNRSAELTFMITVGDVVAVVVDLESTISVYPNPSETSFFITLPQSMPAKTIEVTMVSVLGKRAEIEVERKEGTRDISGMLILPVSHLSSGNYVINLRSGNVKFSKQVVVR